MIQLKVKLKGGNYIIQIGENILPKINFRKFGTEKFAIITDSNVKKLYGETLRKLLKARKLDAELFYFPAGEKSKTAETAIRLARELAKNNFGRDSLIIALGGGVAGDIAGFLASFYMRGINYVQIPTTLLAMVDSSIGGKTGVDIPEGKNMFGAFYQPKAVFIDVNTLKTLPEKEIQNGFAEIIKYGVIRDKNLFAFLEKNYSARSAEFFKTIIEKSCRIKIEIVEKDEKEKELRKILNYGHTVGHAIEAAENYRLSHGEAVALGMAYEGAIASRLGYLSKKDLERQNKLIKLFGLPTTYKGNAPAFMHIMKRDKKNKFGNIHCILPQKIGKIRSSKNKVAFPVEESALNKIKNIFSS